MGGVDWGSERTRNGGLDEVPTPAPGRLLLCGKHLIGPDHAGTVERCGGALVVCLNQRHELADRYPDYVRFLDAAGPDEARWVPVPDLHHPRSDEADALVDVIVDRLEEGGNVLVHCGAGIGRAGTIAAAVLLALGHELDDALEVVAASRPGAGPEAGAQTTFLRARAIS